MARVLIAGCGYVGCALGARLAAASHEVFGLRRRPGTLPPGVRPLAADLTAAASLRDLPPRLDAVFYLASASGQEDTFYRLAYVDGLRTLLEALDKQGQNPRRVFFASSTAVYAQQHGEWVDESSPCEPTHFSGLRLLEGEQALREGPFAGTVVRFGGIYGPRRTGLVERVRTGRARYREHPPRYTNRIHRDDCAGVLEHLLRLSSPDDCTLAVDCEPAEEGALLRWLAGALGAPPPRPLADDEADEGRPRSNKRCRNRRLIASGYAFRYPTFREGYRAVLEELR
jgi:nucleoside-diphosphate-sugar epimerase